MNLTIEQAKAIGLRAGLELSERQCLCLIDFMAEGPYTDPEELSAELWEEMIETANEILEMLEEQEGKNFTGL